MKAFLNSVATYGIMVSIWGSRAAMFSAGIWLRPGARLDGAEWHGELEALGAALVRLSSDGRPGPELMGGVGAWGWTASGVTA